MKIASFFVLLLLTLSSGFAQFAMHMCDDAGVLIATASCSETDKCCDENATNDHCTTEYVYFLTAKFKDAIRKIDVEPLAGFTLPQSQTSNAMASSCEQRLLLEPRFKLKQSHTNHSISGVFLI